MGFAKLAFTGLKIFFPSKFLFKTLLNFVKYNYMGLSINLLVVDWFALVSKLFMLYDLLDVLDFAYNILLGTLGLKVIIVIVLVVSLSGFDISVTLASQKSLEIFLPLCFTMCYVWGRVCGFMYYAQSKILKCQLTKSYPNGSDSVSINMLAMCKLKTERLIYFPTLTNLSKDGYRVWMQVLWIKIVLIFTKKMSSICQF